MPPRPRKVTEDVRRGVVADYRAKVSGPAIAAKYKISTPVVYGILKAAEVPTLPRGSFQKSPLYDSAHSLYEEYQGGKSTTVIAAERGCNPSTVQEIFRAAGLQLKGASEAHRQYQLNETAFADRSCPMVQYWAGVLLADGCVYERPSASPVITFSLKVEDRSHVEAFRQFVGSTHPIWTRESKGGFSKKDGAVCGVGFHSLQMAEDLAAFGVLPRKSFTAEVAACTDSRDLWRGLVDGDGWVSVATRKNGPYPIIGLTGSRKTVEQFAAFCHQIAPEAPMSVAPNGSVWKAMTTGRRAKKVVEALYKDCCQALPRKLATALEIMSLPDGPGSGDWGPREFRPTKKTCLLTGETLLALFAEEGSWRRVAVRLGVHRSTMPLLRRRFGLD